MISIELPANLLQCKWCKKVLESKEDTHPIACGMEFEVVKR